MNSLFVAFLLIAGAAAAPHHSSQKLECFVGSAENNEIVGHFAICESVFDFGTNSVALNGHHKARPQPVLNNVVPGHVTTREDECHITSHSNGLQITCSCFSSLCNFPSTPKELLEERFGSL